MLNTTGWQVEQNGATQNHAAQVFRGFETDVNMDATHVHVDVSVSTLAGQTHSTSTSIPIDVLISMLEHAGYSVTRR